MAEPDDSLALCRLLQPTLPSTRSAAIAPEIAPECWPSLATAASHAGVAPLLYAALRSGERSDAPQSTMDALRLAYIRSSTANRRAFEDLAFWIDRLAQDGIPVVLLKGAALALSIYDDRGWRPMGDLDLLVPADAMDTVQRAILDDGYVPADDLAPGFAARYSAERCFLRMGRRPSQLDIHWHVFTNPYYFERVPVGWFWERTVTVRVGGSAALGLSPTAQLLQLAVHDQLHGDRRLIASYDQALLIERCGEDIEWDELAGAAAEFGLTHVLERSLDELRERWGVSIRDAVHSRLRATPTPWRPRFVVAATRRLHGGDLGIVCGFGFRGLRKTLYYWLRLLFPSPAYMRTRFRVGNIVLISLCYIWRIGKAAFLATRAGYWFVRTAFGSP